VAAIIVGLIYVVLQVRRGALTESITFSFKRFQITLSTFSTLIALLIGFATVILGLVGFFGRTPSPPRVVQSAPNPLAAAAVSRIPGMSPSVDNAIVLTGDSNKAWFISTAGSTTRSSFRQGAAVSLALVPISLVTLPSALIGQRVPAGGIVCLAVFSNAFDISGPASACIDPTAANSDTQSWAWILLAKNSTSGPQTVAVSVNVYANRTFEAQPAISAKTRYLTVDVVRPALDRYSSLVAALLTAIGAIIALLVKSLLDHLWPPKASLNEKQ
jgi:hypothetical protein